MTAKTPDSPQESRPPTAASSTTSVPSQPAEPPTSATPATTPAATATPAIAAASAAPAHGVVAVPAPAAPAVPAKVAPAQVAKPPTAPPPAKPPTKPAGAGRPAPKPRNGSGGIVFVIAILAILIAIGSTLLSLYALDVARQAKSRMADTTTGSTSAPAAPPPAATLAPTPSAVPTTPRAQFVPETVRASLRIPPADGCASVFVDLDFMQVGVDNGHEFYLSSCLGSTTLRVDKHSGAVPTQENPTPEVCVAQLAGSATSSELVLQVRTGLTFCLLTNKDEAARQGLPQRVGIVEVREVAPDRAVTVTVSTYRVPE